MLQLVILSPDFIHYLNFYFPIFLCTVSVNTSSLSTFFIFFTAISDLKMCGYFFSFTTSMAAFIVTRITIWIWSGKAFFRFLTVGVFFGFCLPDLASRQSSTIFFRGLWCLQPLGAPIVCCFLRCVNARLICFVFIFILDLCFYLTFVLVCNSIQNFPCKKFVAWVSVSS